MKCHDRTIRIDAVNDLGAVAVGIVKHGFVATNLLHALAIQMAAFFGVNRGFLYLDNGQGLAVFAIEGIIAVPGAMGVGHPLNLNLNTGFGRLNQIFDIQHIPTSFLGIKADI